MTQGWGVTLQRPSISSRFPSQGSEKRSLHLRSAHQWCSQCSSRCSIQRSCGSRGMGANEGNVPSPPVTSCDWRRQCCDSQHGAEIEVDLFASPLNHKTPVYCTLLPFPITWATNALAQDWNKFRQVLIFPSPDLVKDVAKALLF